MSSTLAEQDWKPWDGSSIEAASKRQIIRDLELRRQDAESEEYLHREQTKLLIVENCT